MVLTKTHKFKKKKCTDIKIKHYTNTQAHSLCDWDLNHLFVSSLSSGKNPEDVVRRYTEKVKTAPDEVIPAHM